MDAKQYIDRMVYLQLQRHYEEITAKEFEDNMYLLYCVWQDDQDKEQLGS